MTNRELIHRLKRFDLPVNKIEPVLNILLTLSQEAMLRYVSAILKRTSRGNQIPKVKLTQSKARSTMTEKESKHTNKAICSCGFFQSYPIPHEHDWTERERQIIEHYRTLAPLLPEAIEALKIMKEDFQLLKQYL